MSRHKTDPNTWPSTKVCTLCNNEKLLQDFPKNGKRGLYGRASRCKECRQTYQKQHYKNNPEFRRRRLDAHRINTLKRVYGLTEEQYYQLLKQNDYRCYICLINLDKSSPINIPHIDHNHITGEIRGILCPRCNNGLGNFRDNIEFLTSAISYLKDYNDVSN